MVKSNRIKLLWPLLLFGLFSYWYFPINLNAGHNWGGDFAQYIAQAAQWSGEEIKGDYIFNPAYPLLGPAAYPQGFPLLLSIAYGMYGNSIPAFLSLIAIFALLYAALSYAFFREQLSITGSILLAIFLMINPQILDVKSEVISDIPFSVFFLTAVLLLKKSSTRPRLVYAAAIFAAYAIFTRSIGWCLLPAVLLFILRNYRRSGFSARPYWHFILFSGALSLLLMWWFPSPSAGQYLEMYRQENSLSENLLQNFNTYLNLLRDAFPVYYPQLQFVQILIGAALLIFSIAGLFSKAFRGSKLEAYAVVAYVGTALLWPANLYFRFFLPILPLLMLLALHGIQQFQGGLRRWLYLTLSLLIGISLYFNFQHAQRIGRGHIPAGPQSEEVRAALNYLRIHSAAHSVVLSAKPRVIALYSERNSFAVHPQATLGEIDRDIVKFGAEWIFYSESHPHPALLQYIADKNAELRFEENGILLYHLPPPKLREQSN